MGLKYFCLLFFLFIGACKNKNISQPTRDKIMSEQDSILIVSTFVKALQQADSSAIWIQNASVLAEKSFYHQDLFNFTKSRYLIQTAQLSQADSLLDNIIATYHKPEFSDKQPFMGKFLNLKASVMAYQGRTEEAVKIYEQALQLFDSLGDDKQSAAVHFNLANIFFGRLDFPASYRHVTIARKQFAQQKDSVNEILATSISAVALIKLDSLEAGKKYAIEALNKSLQLQNPLGLILSNYAMGEYEHSQEHFDKALDYYNRALKFSDSFHIHTIKIPLKAASIDALVKSGNYTKVIEEGTAILPLAKAMNNSEMLYNIHKNLAVAYEKSGASAKAFGYLKEADNIFRDNIMRNNQEVIQELLVKYESEKKNRTILEKESQIKQKNNFLLLSVILIVLVLVILLAYYKINRHQQKIETMRKQQDIEAALNEGEEKERKRLSEELHDGIASALTAMRLQLEYKDGNDTYELLDLIKHTHKEVRQIAHNLMPVDFKNNNWLRVVQKYCGHFSGSTNTISFYTNVSDVALSDTHALILYRAIQECLQNAVKYAEATKISIQVLHSEKNLIINIEDNGIGMNLSEANNTSGIYNLKIRLAHIGAQMNTDSSPGQGTGIFIQYPFKQ